MKKPEAFKLLKPNLEIDLNRDGSVSVWSAETRKWEWFAAHTEEAKAHWACASPLTPDPDAEEHPLAKDPRAIVAIDFKNRTVTFE